MTLDVPLDQVDDVLKSLVVYDSGGSVGEVTLPGREPLAQSFADLPFDPAVLNSAADLLNALQGSEIRIVGPRSLGGRLVHVDQEIVSRTRRRRRDPGAGQRHDAGRVAASGSAGCRGDRLRRPRLAAAGQHRAGADRGLSHIGPAAAQRAHARRRGTHAAARLRRRDAAVEGVVPAQPAGRPGGQNAGENGPAAGLGRPREFQRPALAGCRADAALRQPGDVPAGSLRKLLREAADGAGRIGRPDTAAARCRHRSGGGSRPSCATSARLLPRCNSAASKRPARARPPRCRRCPPQPLRRRPRRLPWRRSMAAQVSEQPTQVSVHGALQGHRRGRAKPDAAAARPRPAGAPHRPVPAGGERNSPARRDRDDQRQRQRAAARRLDALSSRTRTAAPSISATRGSRRFPPATSGC